MKYHSIAILVVLSGTMLAAAPLSGQRIQLAYKLPELESRARTDSLDAAAHYNLALGYWNEKRLDDAEKSLRTAVGIEPRFAPAHLALAFLPFARRPKLWAEIVNDEVPQEDLAALEQSDKEYRHAFLIDPLVDIRIIGAVTPAKPDFLRVKDELGEEYALFFQGFTDCQQGKYEDCNGRFQALIDEIKGDNHPDRIPNSVLWYKGMAAAHLGKFEVSADHYRTLIDRLKWEEKKEGSDLTYVPMQLNEYRYTMATILQAEGKTSDAIAMLQEVLNKDIGYYMAHVRLANIYEAARDFPKAVQERLNAVNANPDDPSLITDLGVTLGRAGQTREAEGRFREALEANPRDVRPLFWLGLIQFDGGNRDAAKESLSRFVATAPSRYDRQLAMAKERLAKLQ
jgi:tetratricopeptide (TPR) repeat protein